MHHFALRLALGKKCKKKKETKNKNKMYRHGMLKTIQTRQYRTLGKINVQTPSIHLFHTYIQSMCLEEFIFLTLCKDLLGHTASVWGRLHAQQTTKC